MSNTAVKRVVKRSLSITDSAIMGADHTIIPQVAHRDDRIEKTNTALFTVPRQPCGVGG